MTLDLGPARRRIEERMTDRCVITRDVEGTADDVFDEETGNLTPPVNDASTIYDGVALFTRLDNLAQGVVLGSVDEARDRYQVSIPFTATAVPLGSVVIATATHDPRLLAKRFVVKSVAVGTHVARQRMTVELATPGPRT